jgi:hypothetical protein
MASKRLSAVQWQIRVNRVIRHSAARIFSLVTLGLMTVPVTLAFDVDGNKWPGAFTTIYTGIPGTSPSGVAWSQALRESAEAWSNATVFKFSASPDYRDPCNRNDRLNGNDFTTTVCGTSFSPSTLAITMIYSEANSLGAADITEADIVYNRNQNFDIYDGPVNFNQFAGVDFRRVALHELGHVMGLNHERAAPAIMAPTIGNLFTLQKDDIDGVNFLYAGTNNCFKTAANFGVTSQALSQGDCRVQQLVSGGTDTSFVDVFALELSEAARISVQMSSAEIDSVLVLADEKLRVLEIMDDNAGTCNALIQRVLQPGSYIILANTYVKVTKCGSNTGPYQISFNYDSSTLRTLKGKVSFQGGSSNAIFSGGVTVNNGLSYTNRVTPDQLFDVEARIAIDPRHQNQPGFIVVAALLADGEILVKNIAGNFVTYNPQLALVPIAVNKVLGAIEEVSVLADTIAAQLDIQNIAVDFLVGYGVSSNPDELYYHQEPINLIVSP